MRLGMSANIGEARRVFNARNLPGIGIRPAAAFFEFDSMIVEEQINRNRRQ